MSIVINFLEAIISSYALSELCDVQDKKKFLILNTTLTFLVEMISDYLDTNFLPLLLLYILIWYTILLVFIEKKNYFYALFIVILINSFINISVILPIYFVYHHSRIFAGLLAKFIQLILTLSFLRYRKKYAYMDNKYWITIIILLICCTFIIDIQGMQIVSGNYSFNDIVVEILVIFIAMISLYFFSLIEQSNIEKERVTKELEKQKYQKITHDIIKHSQDELNRLEHSLTYQMLLVKNEIKDNKNDNAIEIIDSIIDKAHKINHTIYTGNNLLDAFLTLKFNDLDYTIIPCITIPIDEFYENVQFINLILEILDVINTEKLNFILKEEKQYSIIQFASNRRFISDEKIKSIVHKYEDLMLHDDVYIDSSIMILKLKIRK